MAKTMWDSDAPTIVIDFETFYDPKRKYSLKHMTTPEYVKSPLFQLHGTAWNKNGESGFVWGKEDSREFLWEHRAHTFIVHNAHFESMVCDRIGLILPINYPYQWIDTKALAHHVLGAAVDTGISNKLEILAERLGLPTRKGDLSFSEGLRTEEFTDSERRKMEEYAINDANLERGVYDALMPRLLRPDFELWLQDHTIRRTYMTPLLIDTDQIKTTMKMVQARDAEVIKPLEGQTVDVEITIKGKTGRKTMPDEPDVDVIRTYALDRKLIASNKLFPLALAAVLERKGRLIPMKTAKRRKDGSTPQIPALAKDDPGFRALRYDSDPEIRDMANARHYVASHNTVFARLKSLETAAQNGGLYPHLNYYGAHTGRYSGGGGFNIQNLTNPDRANSDTEREAAIGIRKCITAGKGYVFVDVDAAQIERRVLLWLAGMEPDQGDPYANFITKALGTNDPVLKPTKDMDKDRFKWHKDRRNLGKEAVLGLGYCMGANKFMETIRKKEFLAALIGTEFTEQQIRALVPEYRNQHPGVVQLWRDAETAFDTARQGGECSIGDGKILYMRDPEHRVVHAVLPSGRSVRYSEIRKQKRENGKFGGWEWVFGLGRKVYGGALVENIVQAIARDIIVEALWILETYSEIPILMNVHDSLIAKAPKGIDAHLYLSCMIDVMSTSPSWAPDLTLAAEGTISETLV